MVIEHLSKWLDRLASLATIVAGMTIVIWLMNRPGESVAPERKIPQPVEDVSGLTAALPSHLSGSERANLAVIEFGEFQCPYCARHSMQTLPELSVQFIEPGIVRYGFRHFPLQSHAAAFDAAVASECASDQSRFWEVKELLFRDLKSVVNRQFDEHVEASVPDRRRYQDCLTENTASARVRADRIEGERLKVTGTPTFFIGRIDESGRSVSLKKRLNGAQPASVFAAVIRGMLEDRVK